MRFSNWQQLIIRLFRNSLNRLARRRLRSHRLAKRKKLVRSAVASICCVPFVGTAVDADESIFRSETPNIILDDFARRFSCGDFNGDGINDIVTGNTQGTVTVLLGDGTGGLDETLNVFVGGDIGDVVTADFNGDGFQDIVTAFYEDNENGSYYTTLGIMLGLGDGTFLPFDGGLVNTFARVTRLESGDFNGDGFADVAMASVGYESTGSYTGQAYVFLGEGDGSFGPSILVNFGELHYAVGVGDLNGDGFDDIAVPYPYLNDVDVYLATKDENFLFAGRFEGPGLDFADFNGDGILDRASSTSVALGNGDGTFESPVNFGTADSWLIIGDYNDDGNLDIVTSEGSYLGNGDGTLSVGTRFDPEISSFTEALSLNADSDGLLDFAFLVGSPRRIEIALGVGNGSFLLDGGPSFGVGSSPRDLLVSDFNNDGTLDLATANLLSDDVSVLIGLGDGRFAESAEFAVGNSPGNLVAADFDGDGNVDLATSGTSPGSFSILAGFGDGSFAPAVTLEQQEFNLAGIAAGDFNSDGFADLAAANFLIDVVTLHPGLGNGGFQDAEFSFFDDLRGPIVVADFNQDGIDDVITGEEQDTVTLLGSPNGFTAPLVTDGISFISGSVNDINADGIPDLVSRSFFSPVELHTALGDGTGQFLPSQSISVSDFQYSIAEDFNNDGMLDILTSGASGVHSLFLGIGNGMVADSPIQFAQGQAVTGALAADLNSDGFLDLAFTDAEADRVFVQLNRLGTQVLIGDINRDGAVDLLDVQPFVTVLVNMQFQAEADINGDCSVDLLDVQPFVELLMN